MHAAPATDLGPSTRRDGISRSHLLGVTGAALLIGLLRRLTIAGPPGFPMGEGGLFLLFSQGILDAGLRLPLEVAYGGEVLPFAYPPLAFWLAAGLSRLTGAGLESVYYYLPLFLNLLAIPAFCLLAARALGDRVAFALAALLYVQLPESYIWQITGGGLPRALGALFALLAVAAALRGAGAGSWRAGLVPGALTGFAILSHMEWGMFAATGVALAFLLRGRGWERIPPLATAGAVALSLAAPWLIFVLFRYGLAPFLSGASAGGNSISAFLDTMLSGRLFALALWPAALGLFVALRDRDWFLAAWPFLVLLLTPRMGLSAGVAIPAALLAGVGLKSAGEFFVALAADVGRGQGSRLARFASRPVAGVPLAAFGLLLLISAALSTGVRNIFVDPTTVRPLEQPTRRAMAWIAANSAPDARFVVLSDAKAWYADRTAEWFPVLARRASLTTAQGLEWAGPGVFTAKLRELDALKGVQASDADLLPAFVERHYCRADHVALFVPPDAAERAAFARDRSYAIVHSDAGAAVYRRAVPASGCRA